MSSSKQLATLDAELAELQAAIRRDAASAKLRVHLFQLLCVMGNWTRALSQLQLCGQMDVKALPMAQTYREAIRCELFRAEVFAGRRTPQVMGQPPAWIGSLIDALRHDGAGQFATSAALRQKAMDEAAPVAFTVDGQRVEWLADADSRLGPVLEVIANGQYYWLPFQSCKGVSIEAPVDLRDKVWAAAEVLLPNEGCVPVLIPARYAGTTDLTGAEGDDLRRGRLTEWREPAEGMWFGLGQRMWSSDVGEHPIFDTRKILQVDSAAA
ncbi:MAG: virulence protein SciE type [Burkholderiales bacterium]|nr:virulence protein SciE type [Burkholderiales bacterium]